MQSIASVANLPHFPDMATDILHWTVRIPRTLKDKMSKDAERHSRSLNAHFVRILQLYFDGKLVPVEDLVKTPAVRNLIKEIVKETAK